MSGIDEGRVHWPSEVAAQYRERGWWTTERLDAIPGDRAAADPDGDALVEDGDRWSNARLATAVERRAAGLHALGITGGDRIVVALPNDAGFVVTFFALLRVGAAPVLALPALREVEIVHLATTTEAVGYIHPGHHLGFDHGALATAVAARCPSLRLVVAASGPGGDGSPTLDAIDADPRERPERPADEIAFFLLSGGTTGLPKVIPRTHEDYRYNIRCSAAAAGLDRDDVFLAVLAAGHNFTLGCPGILGTLAVGGVVVLGGDRSPDECAALLAPHGVTYTALTPTAASGWVDLAADACLDVGRLRTVQVGAAKLGPRLADLLHDRLGVGVAQVFGMSEGMLLQTRPDEPHDVVREVQGTPVSPGDEIRVVDDLDRPVEDGTEGHLLVRGPYTIRGYYRAPEHNRTAFTDDGFYRSGDIVRRRPDGRWVVTGRAKDVVNRGGESIGAAEVEEHLRHHRSIRDAAVVGLPDERLGERSCAVVVCESDAAGAVRMPAVRRHLRDRGLAPFKWPDVLRELPDLPRTPLGKIDKAALRALLTDDLRGRR